MKKGLFLITFFTSLVAWSQNVQVDAQSYSPQQLIEDVLIDSNCISNVIVTNVVGGNFNGSDQSYGYFDATGTSFPFQSGVVLSTGRLNNVEGPNNSLSDDDAPNWGGDDDLEEVLNENNTLNATILEFDFVSVANQISFRYIFASEEYQEGNSNTCQYSDLFGFLIRPENNDRYQNIALVPGTQTPVKVTTVHSGIPGSCNPVNEAYFGGWNDSNAPINFNGQTAVLTATANVVPNTTYHVKLVIADEQNYRYDSAVFLEAGSFNLQTNLGPDRLIATNNALCPNETLELDATQPGTNTYTWFKDNVLIPGANTSTYTVSDAGIYTVEVNIDGTCLSTGSIEIEYDTNPTVSNTILTACDLDLNGFTVFDLFESVNAITLGNTNLNIIGFYESFNNASQDIDEIPNPSAYYNTSVLQTVYARVENNSGCFSIAEIVLDIANNTVTLNDYPTCDDDFDGFSTFNLNDIIAFIQQQNGVPMGSNILLFESENDMVNQQNALSGTFENNQPFSQTLFVQIANNGNCFAFTTINLIINPIPELEPDESIIYCLNSYPETLTLDAGLLNGPATDYSFEWFLNGTTLNNNSNQIAINEIGNYQVTVTNSANCSASRTITVEASNEATITNIAVEEASNNNSIIVTVSGEGNYEYALNNGMFQDSNYFSYLSPGFYTVFVRDKNGCGIVSEETAILGFPKFFTPNGDGDNDYWQPLGVRQEYKGMRVLIFDRYGKLIKEIGVRDNGWNGQFNGQNLISTDYWYVAILPNGKEYRGHFALVR